jgi:1,4-dihydroxy-2-naphthoyl-CoA hydrolase
MRVLRAAGPGKIAIEGALLKALSAKLRVMNTPRAPGTPTAQRIWRNEATPEILMERARNTLAEHLGIRVIEIGPDYLRATMPVNRHTHQPMGILHGGASVALAETVGSLAANLCVDLEKYICVGQEINANHVRPAKSGLVTGTARPFHIGGRSQVWGIEIRDENDKLVCVSRLTMAVVERK